MEETLKYKVTVTDEDSTVLNQIEVEIDPLAEHTPKYCKTQCMFIEEEIATEIYRDIKRKKSARVKK